MQISEIASLNTSAATSVTSPSPVKSKTASSPAPTPQPTPAATFIPSVSAPASSTQPAASAPTPAPAVTPSSPVAMQGSAGLSAANAAAVAYSTTVNGVGYSGTVQESEGAYVAYVPSPPPGASASGSSVLTAEDNLNLLLSTLA